MSYTFAVVLPPVPDDDAEAWKALDQFTAEQGPAPDVFRKLHDELTARFPCLCSLPDEEIDNGVWSDGPLWNNFGHRAAVLGMMFSRVEDALPFVIETAAKFGLTVFDWQTNEIHRPRGIKGLTLAVEGRSKLPAPTLHQLHAAVDALTPRGGPGFLILEGLGGDYVQAAGGDGAYTVEWREYSGPKFRHWVAGIPGLPSEEEIAIPTFGCVVTVQGNERLNAGHVKTILASFAERQGRPLTFAWREITSQFA
jgi:hypothetical protein